VPVRTLRRRVGALLAASLLVPLLVLTSATPASAGEPKLIVSGGGWGHGVGMGQFGAEGMGRQGKTATQILQHYYRGATVGSAGPWNDVRVLLDQVSATHEIVPSAKVTVTYPGGSKDVLAGQVLAIGGNKTTLWIKVNGKQIAAPTSSSGVRALVALNGNPVTLRRAGGATIGRYGRGTLEVSTGISGCAANNCAVVRNLTMDQYLYGLAEVPSSWTAPALQAQAIAGRSYAAIRVASPRAPGLYHLLATTMDQYYNGWTKESEPTYGVRWVQAVNATSGKVLTYNGKIVQAFYSSTTGGQTENSDYVWSAQPGYLKSVPDPTDNISPRHRWTREYTLKEIGAWFGVSNVRDVRITGSVGVSGRIDKATVEIIGSTTKKVSGNQFRSTVNSRVPDTRALWSTKVSFAVTSFPDVPPNSYYATAVSWLVDKGITTGVGDTGLFKPDDPVNRAQMVTFLWRMMGKPTGYAPHGFPDVPSGSYYDLAVRWAKARGITTGIGGANRFAPNDVVNRAQMAVFLHRTAGLKGATKSHPFPDVPRASWYDAAVDWASQYGITTGVGDTGLYKPLDPVIRAQMAVFLHRTAGTSTAWATSPPPTAP